ncbi:PREDICTED: mitochondrial coenzyme A transporter SLC25A42-like [Papilio polytes]|uniref:mitochondrial coenzyme A transporter SLC25A42-like n=1 Tax=Papilio polytes TaxID=76194 RepID=UPI0006762A4B|nr:PREDICTED: mitochondrial coenzyme A transporter SLC25A42-like [Papilio polytes]
MGGGTIAVGERSGFLQDDRTSHTRQTPRQMNGGLLLVTSLAAGATAGAVAKTVIAPLDRAKIRFQTSDIPYSTRAAVQFLVSSARTEGVIALWRGNSATMARIVPYAAIQFAAHEQWKKVFGVDTPQAAKLVHIKVAREEGIRTLYRGYPATILGVIPYAGVSFFTYDLLKRWYTEYFGSPAVGLTNILLGGCAGALAQTASYPLDIVRRRMQTARRNQDATYPCPNMSQTLQHIYRVEGWRGFFKGLSMNWVKGPIAVGVSFATYDFTKTLLRNLAPNVQSS